MNRTLDRPADDNKSSFASQATDHRPVILVQVPKLQAPVTKVYIQQPQKEHALADFATYAPAVPGVVVALLGLFASHKLSQWRDRDKAVIDLAVDLKETAEDAAGIAVDAWLDANPSTRLIKVHNAKQKIQALGIGATNLALRSEQHGRRKFNELSWRQRFEKRSFFTKRRVHVIKEVSAFRRAADADPFEDPTRGADSSRIPKITKALGNLTSMIDRSLTEYDS